MGKGLSIWVISELMFYVSASLIPLALPLAILLSSIMTVGNLAENNELTALKSSGLSLYRILRPLTYMVITIALFTFYFANYVIPVANLKWHALIYDIQNTKISTLLKEGAYTKELDGYAIKVGKIKDNDLEEILIHDRTSQNTLKTIKAETGTMYKSKNGKYLFLDLKNGYALEELNTQSPIFTENGQLIPSNSNNHPSQRTSFSAATYKIDLSGFSFNQSEENLFKDDYEMMNVFQLNKIMDSVNNQIKGYVDNFSKSLKNAHISFQEKIVVANQQVGSSKNQIKKDSIIPYEWDKLSAERKITVVNNAQSKIRRQLENIEGQVNFLNATQNNINHYKIEFHRKLALTVSIIILFFIGAPLGAIVKKGGFGAPVVIAALLFMLYFVLTSIGDSMSQGSEPLLSPFWGMWFPTFLLAPIAFILMRAAANDRSIFDKDMWKKLFHFKRSKAQ